MVTFVGTQDDFGKAIQELVELEYDAIEAYETAIHRLESQEYKKQLRSFKDDHDRHLQEFSTLLVDHGIDIPSGPSIGKQWLAKGKVVLGNLVGDRTILMAMNSNEQDTNTAYARIDAHPGKWTDAEAIIAQGVKDEKYHKQWLESTLDE